MLDVSIIIVNWNTRDLLQKCLQHLESTIEKVDYETIVVDNDSADGSQALVRETFPAVRLIENTENVGFARANNQGLAISQGRYVLLLNSDAFVQANTIDMMVEFMDDHPEAGMSACKLLYEDGNLQPSCYAFPTLTTEFYTAVQLDKLFPHSQTFGKFLMTYWDFDEVRAVDAVMGAFMLVRRQVLDQVGGMDESYFMYSEEIDWCYRIKKQGWQIIYNPAVQTIHVWGGSSQRVRGEMLIQLYRSKVAFFRKNYGQLAANLLKFVVGFGCLLRIGPGALYYFRMAGSYGREQYRFYRQLLLLLPGF